VAKFALKNSAIQIRKAIDRPMGRGVAAPLGRVEAVERDSKGREWGMTGGEK